MQLILRASRIKIKLNRAGGKTDLCWSEFSISITDPGLEGLGLSGDEGHDDVVVVLDVLDVGNEGAGASVLLLPPPQTSQSPFPFPRLSWRLTLAGPCLTRVSSCFWTVYPPPSFSYVTRILNGKNFNSIQTISCCVFVYKICQAMPWHRFKTRSVSWVSNPAARVKYSALDFPCCALIFLIPYVLLLPLMTIVNCPSKRQIAR